VSLDREASDFAAICALSLFIGAGMILLRLFA
jgi:hypothetical protein